ncbi:MAG: hypothetical protein HQK53_18035, partial [Oligoflexia bacterium]|nr:hypothetical protein [Oligoflexia bacterium]
VQMSAGDTIEEIHLPEMVRYNIDATAHIEPLELLEKNLSTSLTLSAGKFPLEFVRKKYIVYTLEKAQGNKTQAAKHLGITTKTLYNQSYSTDFVSAGADKTEVYN